MRVPDQLDQRMKRVVLTAHGKQLFFDVLPVMRKTREEVEKNIPKKDINTFKNVLIHITSNLENEEG